MLYIQKDSPGKAKEANWLPAPNDTVYLVVRLYWPSMATQNRVIRDSHHAASEWANDAIIATH